MKPPKLQLKLTKNAMEVFANYLDFAVQTNQSILHDILIAKLKLTIDTKRLMVKENYTFTVASEQMVCFYELFAKYPYYRNIYEKTVLNNLISLIHLKLIV